MDSALSEIKPESGKRAISKTQMIILAVVLILAGSFLLGRRFGWFAARHESVVIPSGQSYVEATVTGAYEGVVLANRVARPDVAAREKTLPKKLEILTDEKTVFAKLTSSGPVKISRAELSEGDIVWVYNRVRTADEMKAEQVDPDLVIPFAEMLKNPRERIKADFIAVVIGKK